jgi:hypothetical protein
VPKRWCRRRGRRGCRPEGTEVGDDFDGAAAGGERDGVDAVEFVCGPRRGEVLVGEVGGAKVVLGDALRDEGLAYGGVDADGDVPRTRRTVQRRMVRKKMKSLSTRKRRSVSWSWRQAVTTWVVEAPPFPSLVVM